MLSGCGRKTAKPAYSQEIESLTLQDLKSPDATPFQSQVFFDIVTFQLPAEKVEEIEMALSQFQAFPVKLYSRELFVKNGLSVFYGRASDGDILMSQMRLLGVKRTARMSLITMDKTDELFSTSLFGVERYVSSNLYGDRKVTQTFGPGRIGFVITPSSTVRRDAVNVKIVPAYVPYDGANIRMALGKNELGQKPFPQGRLETVMQEGDFLVLAPNRIPEEASLDMMLFGPERDKNKMRMYVILFIRAGEE